MLTAVRSSLPFLILTLRFQSRLFLNAHDRGFCPQPLKVVWYPLLQGDTEGPTLIFSTVAVEYKAQPRGTGTRRNRKRPNGPAAGERVAPGQMRYRRRLMQN